MADVATGLFTIGVFQDLAWARKGVDALKHAGFAGEGMSMLVKESADAAGLVQQTFGAGGERLDVNGIGPLIAQGPLVDALQGARHDFATLGLAATIARVGFQPHDGRIFETLTARGGVLVAIRSEPRASDALAILHAYGGGNAAIGAWGGRV